MLKRKLPEIAAAQLEFLRRTLELETGMDLTGSRRRRLEDALARVLNTLFAEVELDLLFSDPRQREALLAALMVELSVGESYFFRNPHHFRTLREQVLPRLMQDARGSQQLRVWSAGCATGEEPYSLAILIDQLFGELPGWKISILGTDLNPWFIDRARAGLFRRWSFRQSEIQHDPRYFRVDARGHRIQPRLKAWVQFECLNLVRDPFPSPHTATMNLDLILFRNVAIYLKPDVTANLLRKFYQALRPGGWLLLGETEVSLASPAGFEVHQSASTTLFRKPHLCSPSAASVPLLDNEFPIVAPPTADELRVPKAPVWSPLEMPWRNSPPGLIHAHAAVAAPLPPLDSSTGCDPLARVRGLLAESLLCEARLELQRCLRLHPFLVEGYLLQANLAEDAGDLRSAESAYRQALYLDRECCLAHLHVAMIHQQLGDVLQSQRSLHTAIRLSAARQPEHEVEYGDGLCYGLLHEWALQLKEQLP